MKCPKCCGDVRIKGTVHTEENEIYRRRKCLSCGHVFFTMEFEIENTPAFQKEWSNLCDFGEPSHKKRGRKIYTVYLTKNDEIVASGTAEECAKQMGMSNSVFRTTISRAKTAKRKKYEVYVYSGREEELEEK